MNELIGKAPPSAQGICLARTVLDAWGSWLVLIGSETHYASRSSGQRRRRFIKYEEPVGQVGTPMSFRGGGLETWKAGNRVWLTRQPWETGSKSE